MPPKRDEPSSQLVRACQQGDLPSARYWLTSEDVNKNYGRNADIHTDDDQPLIESCMSGNLELVRYLLSSPELKEHANIHTRYGLPLGIAFERSNLALAQFLCTSEELPQKALMGAHSVSGLVLACDEGHLDVVRFALTSGQVLKEDGEPFDLHHELTASKVLRSAIQSGNEELVCLVIKEGQLPSSGHLYGMIEESGMTQAKQAWSEKNKRASSRKYF